MHIDTTDTIVVEGTESRALTGLRGLAALLVVAHHAALHLGLGDGVPVVHPLLHRGYLGVDLFFVLSGFVLSMTYAHWFDGTRRGGVADYARFLSRRVARLWPLHATVVLLLMLFYGRDADLLVTPNRLLANLLMVQAWGISAAINPPAWSVSAEMLAYGLFPALVLMALRGRVRAVLCAAAVVVALVACIHFGPPLGAARRGQLDLYENYSLLPALRCLAGFTTGMLAWRAGLRADVRRWARRPWVGALAAASMTVLLLQGHDDLIVFPLLPLLVLAMHNGRGALYRALAHGPVYRLGVLSYAIYLVHFAVLTRAPVGWAPAPVVAVALGLAILVIAVAAHWTIEVPGRRLLRQAAEAVLWRAALLTRRTEQP